MDAQEHAKNAAVGKKPSVRFAESDTTPNQIQPIFDGLQKVLQTVLDNQKLEVKTGEANNPGNGGCKKEGVQPPSSAASDCSISTQNNENRGGQREPL